MHYCRVRSFDRPGTSLLLQAALRPLGADFSETVTLMSKLTALSDRAGCFLPGRNSSCAPVCFMNQRGAIGGPGVFAARLIQEFARRGVRTTHRHLQSASAALLFSLSWGAWFKALCRGRGVRTVLRVNGFAVPRYFDGRPQPPGYQDRRMTPERKRLNRRMARDIEWADHVIFQSEFARRMACEYLHDRRERCSVVWNGVDTSIFRPREKNEGPVRLLSAGIIRDEYMMGSVLGVFQRLAPQCDCELRICGTMDAENERQLSRFCDRHPEWMPRIQRLGPVPNPMIADVLRDCDILIHPRLGDFCPNIVVECMASGLAVVCGSWGGAAELVGPAGEVVPTVEWSYGPEYVDGLALAVQHVMDDLGRFKNLARQRALEKMDIRLVGKAYLESLGFGGLWPRQCAGAS
jgi:glycosyltransferase involved in cell wall biosynthesis